MPRSGHLQHIERELRALLAEGNTEAIVKWVKERVLESYRNGMQASKAGPEQEAARPPAQAAEPPAQQ